MHSHAERGNEITRAYVGAASPRWIHRNPDRSRRSRSYPVISYSSPITHNSALNTQHSALSTQSYFILPPQPLQDDGEAFIQRRFDVDPLSVQRVHE